MMPRIRSCQTCGQPLRFERAGVYLPPIKAAIFDAVAAAGDIGVSLEELQHLELWRDRRPGYPPGTNGMRAHVWQINNQYLIETDVHIHRVDQRYVLMNRPTDTE